MGCPVVDQGLDDSEPLAKCYHHYLVQMGKDAQVEAHKKKKLLKTKETFFSKIVKNPHSRLCSTAEPLSP